MIQVGVISDTHGLLRPEVLEWLSASDHIIHASDIGKPEIVPRLEAIAPTTAIRGNVDTGTWADVYPLGPSIGALAQHRRVPRRAWIAEARAGYTLAH